MHIELRPSGKWRARLRLIGQPQISKTFNDKAAAERWSRAMEDAAASGKLPEHLAGEMTLRDLRYARPPPLNRCWLERWCRCSTRAPCSTRHISSSTTR